MEWSEFLVSKKIDNKAFHEKEPELWAQLKGLFDQMHPKSFVAQKLYLINPIRRKYTLAEDDIKDIAAPGKPVKPAMKSAKPKVQVRPKAVIRPKPVFKRPK